MSKNLSRLVLIVLTVVYAGLGFAFLFFTPNMIGVLPVTVSTPDAYAEIMAVYGGQALALAAIFAWGAAVPGKRRMALTVAAVILAGLVVGRVIGMLWHSPVSIYSMGIAALEFIGCVFSVLGLMQRATKRHLGHDTDHDAL